MTRRSQLPDQTEGLSVRIEVMWCSSGRHAPEFFSKSVVICSDLIQPVKSVRNLWIWLDLDCFMTTHINKTTRSFYAAFQLHSHLMCGSFSLHLLSHQRLTKAIQLWLVYFHTSMILEGIQRAKRNRLRKSLSRVVGPSERIWVGAIPASLEDVGGPSCATARNPHPSGIFRDAYFHQEVHYMWTMAASGKP